MLKVWKKSGRNENIFIYCKPNANAYFHEHPLNFDNMHSRDAACKCGKTLRPEGFLGNRTSS